MLAYADAPKERVLEELKSEESGLGVSEAASRLERYGKNELKSKKKTSVLGLFIAQFGDLMTILLIAAACVSAIIAALSGELSDLADTAIIAAIIVLNAVVGTVQQYRADKAIESLKKLNSTTAKVRRGGEIMTVDATELTVGDIVILEEGDVVPADLRIIKATSLRCDEAALSGESQSVEKSEAPVCGKAVTISNAKSLAFSSTFVVGGSGEGVVVAVGQNTEIGKIAEMLKDVKAVPSPLEKSLNKLGKIITVFVVAVALVVFAVGALARGMGLLKNFMTAVAVAVAAIPEGLPAVVSVIMAMGVKRMSGQNVVIRKLRCVETLGVCTTICTDKTGTLTENKMKVVKVYSSSKNASIEDSTGAIGELLTCMATCTRVKRNSSGYVGDPTETAIRAYADVCGFEGVYSVTGEIPFSSDRKMMTVRVEDMSGIKSYSKGAPEEILKRCTKIGDGVSVRPIVAADRQAIAAVAEKLSGEALRTLAFAYSDDGMMKESDLVFLGLCGLEDGLKAGVTEAVAACKNAGIATVMITGDSAVTALSVARKAGIADSLDEVFTGEQLDAMSKPQLKEAVMRGRVFARVSPRHKNIIVKLRQAQGDVVAMTGDGVNDAPSVKSADIGIVMGKSGTEVTKSVADMVICDDNFTTIVSAVREGRRISSNIKKTIQFFLSTNLAEVLAIVIATFAFISYNFLPSTQLLWINLITDSFPVLALGVERGDGDDMSHPPESAKKSLFSGRSLSFILISALYMTAAVIGVYAFTLFNYGNDEAVTVAFVTLSLTELFHAFNVRSGMRSAFCGIFSNKVLLVTVILGIAVNVGLCLSPLAPAFSIAELPANLWGLVFGVSLSVIVFGEIYKLIVRLFRRIKSGGGSKSLDAKRIFKKSDRRSVSAVAERQ